jgi:hypothetical protein
MRRQSTALATAVAGCVVALVPQAHAEIVPMAPHEKSFASPSGVRFTVGNRSEYIDRIPPLNMTGTTREALLTNTAYASINGPAGGKLTVGYHLGCAVDLQNGVAGATDYFFPGDLSPPAPGSTTRENTYFAPVLTMTLGPGKIVDVKLGEKDFTGSGSGGPADLGMHIAPDGSAVRNNSANAAQSALSSGDGTSGPPPEPPAGGAPAMIVTRDFHVVINGCTGPVAVRQFTMLQVKTPQVDDSGVVFGDPTWL